MNGQLTFALVSTTKLVSAADLFRMAPALERNAQHCAAAWGLLPPAIEIVDEVAKLPRHCHPIVFVDNEQADGALAVHYYDPVRGGPAARVFCDASSGLNSGHYSICEAASHEIVEARCYPRVNLWADYPPLANAGAQVALEVADPVQTHYSVVHGGTVWRVANFVTPQWFDRALLDEDECKRFLAAGGKFDHSGELQRPGQLGPEGYAVLRQHGPNGWTVWDEWGPAGSKLDGAKARARRHPWSRTLRRGVPVS